LATRVFELAKALGVRSKDILDKCHAEGLDLKNHMAALSAGLEATIREWFSDSAAAHSAVETAQSVDLETARQAAAVERKRRRHRGADGVAVEEGEEPPTAAEVAAEGAEVAAEELPATDLTAEAPPQAVEVEAEAVVTEAAPVEVAPSALPVEAAPPAPPAEAPAQVEAVVEPAKPKEPEMRAVPNKPAMPPIIKPAGPQVVPRPAKLQGPRVVRVETPDRLPTPQRRPRPTAEPTTPATAGAAAATTLPRRGRAGPAVGEEGEEGKGGPKSKKRSPRRRGGGRSAAATTTDVIREWREQDLTERAERLAAATGGGLRRHRANVHRTGEGKSIRGGACEIEAPITVKSLSAATGLKAADLIKKLMAQGVMAGTNQSITAETAHRVEGQAAKVAARAVG
jgi:translation initiation factor IF-2